MVTHWNVFLASLIAFQRIAELYKARNNKIWALKQGAHEFGAKHYPLFFLLHLGWLAGWVEESIVNDNGLSQFWYVWLAFFFIAQALRYWCIISLGNFWNTRILVIPGETSIHKGPYRFLRHPNYLAVAIEILTVPMIFNAVITAIFASIFNFLLTVGIRIPQENLALKQLKTEFVNQGGK